MLGRWQLAASTWVVLCSCFTGTFLAGQPCLSDADCGPSLTCQDGVCGGRDATSTSTTSASTPTTTAASASGEATSPTSGPMSSSTTSSTSGVATDPSSSTSETGGGCGMGSCKDLDILVVLDNSASMSDKSTVLTNALIAVITALAPVLNEACSVHIGATTTDAYANNPPECQALGALIQADQFGRPCIFSEGHPYATLADLDDPFSLACTGSIGSAGSADERPIDALLSVFNPDLAACNDGFIRKGARFVLVLVTDEEDDNDDAQGNSGSQIPPQSWKTAINTFKPEADTYVVGVLGDGNPACPWMPIFKMDPDGDGAENSPLLRGLVQSYPEEQHVLASICELDMAAITDLQTELEQEFAAFCGA